MKYFTILCTLGTLTIFPSQVHLDIDNISGKSIRIYYTDINGIQERKIKTDTYISIPIQTTTGSPDLPLFLKIGNKPLKDYVVPQGTYRKYTINPDPEIRKAEKLKRKKRRIRFK
jgi:hypothetical protein